MSNLRIVQSNNADSATLSASNTAGALVADNLKSTFKSQVYRSTGTTTIITAEWAAAQYISIAAFAFANFSSAATMRVKGYTLSGDVTPSFDTGDVVCCSEGSLADYDWGEVGAGANSFAYGGGVYATAWTPLDLVQKITIEIKDPTNSLGYIEAGRLIIGKYWQAERNADYGAQINYIDRSQSSRNDAGDLMIDRGTRHKSMSLSFALMPTVDRDNLTKLLINNGTSRPFFISLYPENSDPKMEQMHTVWGVLTDTAPISSVHFDLESGAIDVVEV